jgi:hypothetical protein
MNEDLLVRLIEKVEHRFYGKYRAFVVDNADPENRGRLRLRVPSVMGNDVVTGWALPCAPYGGTAGTGFFYIPENDAGVWAEFESGLLEYPVWVGTFWAKPGGSTEVPPPGDSQSPPTSKIIKTLKHTIELADEDGSEAIKITDDTHGNKITMDDNGVEVEDKNGNKITMASGSVTIKSDQIKVGAGASAESLVLGTTLMSLLTSWHLQLATHTHVGNLGAPTSPPTPPLSPPSLDSAKSQHHVVE